MIAFLLLFAQDVDDLVERLRDPDIEVREEAQAALEAAGDRAVPALLRALESDDAEVRARAIELIDLAGARAPVEVLELSLADARDLGQGRIAATLRAKNTGRVPIVLRRTGLSATGLDLLERGADFIHLAPGETIGLKFASEVTARSVVLRAHYQHQRPENGRGWPRAPENLALEGLRSGEEVELEVKLFERDVRIFGLKNADAREAASILRDLFELGDGRPPSITVASDTRTNSIIVKAGRADLAIVAKLVEALDKDPIFSGPR